LPGTADRVLSMQIDARVSSLAMYSQLAIPYQHDWDLETWRECAHRTTNTRHILEDTSNAPQPRPLPTGHEFQDRVLEQENTVCVRL
jgi:hypothetical protein